MRKDLSVILLFLLIPTMVEDCLEMYILKLSQPQCPFLRDATFPEDAPLLCAILSISFDGSRCGLRVSRPCWYMAAFGYKSRPPRRHPICFLIMESPRALPLINLETLFF